MTPRRSSGGRRLLAEASPRSRKARLAELLRGQVADYKVPETWSVRRDHGKVLKRVLRDEVAKVG